MAITQLPSSQSAMPVLTSDHLSEKLSHQFSRVKSLVEQYKGLETNTKSTQDTEIPILLGACDVVIQAFRAAKEAGLSLRVGSCDMLVRALRVSQKCKDLQMLKQEQELVAREEAMDRHVATIKNQEQELENREIDLAFKAASLLERKSREREEAVTIRKAKLNQREQNLQDRERALAIQTLGLIEREENIAAQEMMMAHESDRASEGYFSTGEETLRNHFEDTFQGEYDTSSWSTIFTPTETECSEEYGSITLADLELAEGSISGV